MYLAALFLMAALAACSRSPEKPAPAVPVVVAQAVEKAVPVQVRTIGNVVPTTTVTLRARVGGVLRQIHFAEGETVRQGQKLFTIDRGPLEAEMRQAQANLAKSQAQLTNARREAERYRQLYERGLVAQSQYEQLATTAAALEAQVRADRAVVENARLQVQYATIEAPMTGRTGAVQVHEGDLIQTNQTALVVINRIQPIDVAFALPERQLAEVQRLQGESPLAVTALAPQTRRPLAEGALAFIDNRVDRATGTVQLKATFPNADGQLWPGQFVDVVLTLGVDPSAVVVPTAAVKVGQEGRHVFVVRPDRTVELRPVTVAREVGQEAVIAQGVRAGETVVTEGQLRLVPGAHVEAREAPQPAASPPTSP